MSVNMLIAKALYDHDWQVYGRDNWDQQTAYVVNHHLAKAQAVIEALSDAGYTVEESQRWPGL
jgi:hypothetical protein